MKKCFVVSPIGDEGTEIRHHADKVLKYLITPVCHQLDYSVVRADQITGSSHIDQDVFTHLKEDDLVIADLTDLNANVLIEVGYRLRDGKPMILICDKTHNSKLPFDIATFRTIFYCLEVDKIDSDKDLLIRYIQASYGKNTPEKPDSYFRSLHPEVANSQIFRLHDDDGMSVPKSSVPEKIQEELLSKARKKLNNSDISWD